VRRRNRESDELSGREPNAEPAALRTALAPEAIDVAAVARAAAASIR